MLSMLLHSAMGTVILGRNAKLMNDIAVHSCLCLFCLFVCLFVAENGQRQEKL